MTALSVVGIGLRSSLGGVVPSCAAARAGVARRSSIAVVPSGAAEPFNATGHVCSAVAALQDWGRLSGLAVLALQDLSPELLAQLRADESVRLHVAAPSASSRAALDDIEDVERSLPGGGAEFLRARIATWLGWRLDSNRVQLHEGLATAGAEALRAAAQAIEAGQCQRAVVVGVDSQVEESNVERILGAGRLKSGAQPNGFHPGEGAAALVVQRAGGPAKSTSPELMRIEALVIESESGERAEPPRPNAAVLERVLAQALALDEAGVERLGALLTDLNGEPSRVEALWIALQRQTPPAARVRGRARWQISESFGDLGAATVPFQLCVAARAFARGYAPGPEFLAICADDSGAACAIRVSAPQLGNAAPR